MLNKIPTLEELEAKLKELENQPKVNLIELALTAQRLSLLHPVTSDAIQIARDKEEIFDETVKW